MKLISRPTPTEPLRAVVTVNTEDSWARVVFHGADDAQRHLNSGGHFQAMAEHYLKWLETRAACPKCGALSAH